MSHASRARLKDHLIRLPLCVSVRRIMLEVSAAGRREARLKCVGHLLARQLRSKKPNLCVAASGELFFTYKHLVLQIVRALLFSRCCMFSVRCSINILAPDTSQVCVIDRPRIRSRDLTAIVCSARGEGGRESEPLRRGRALAVFSARLQVRAHA